MIDELLALVIIIGVPVLIGVAWRALKGIRMVENPLKPPQK